MARGGPAIRRGQVLSPNTRSPTFSELATTPGMTVGALMVALTTPHAGMPMFVLTATQREDIIAYILSLRWLAAVARFRRIGLAPFHTGEYMKTKLAVIVIGALVLVADQANAQRRTTAWPAQSSALAGSNATPAAIGCPQSRPHRP
jgi:hypothetical protein